MPSPEDIEIISRWLDLRAGLRVGAGRAENMAIADLLRTGDWLEELEELSQCKL